LGSTYPERLIIFTRYPQPGKAKTRLIPALGAAGAADLHRQMAEYTVLQAKTLRDLRPVAVEIWFAADSAEQMQAWLGADLVYQEQQGTDLGDRLCHACQTAFAAGSTAVVIIGTDCPDLDAALLAKALQELQQQDLVLGPATDGGYYLIGLRRFIPELFTGIAWSTSEVLQQTIQIAEKLGLEITTFPTLSDIDLPEDLPLWHRIQVSQ
jgi:rSAM/selenodomain-associated transferase 1